MMTIIKRRKVKSLMRWSCGDIFLFSESIQWLNLFCKKAFYSKSKVWKVDYFWKTKSLWTRKPFWGDMAYSLENSSISKVRYFPKSKPFRPKTAYFPNLAYFVEAMNISLCMLVFCLLFWEFLIFDSIQCAEVSVFWSND